MEETLWIQVNDSGRIIRLEGRFFSASSRQEDGARGVVICHPHPLYGGDMENGVVVAIQRAFSDLGMSTLRFNFRGVGASEGSYDDGRGEVEDLISACRFMRSRGIITLYGAGYSFGSWILLRGYSRESFKGLVLIAPPLDVMDFEGLKLPMSIPSLIVVGSRDEFCSQRSLQLWLGESMASPNSLIVIEGENHFFWRTLPQIEGLVRDRVKLWKLDVA
ncbi:MAG: hypothetical protein N2260_08905 [Syntrophobacterales bacterium]|nr:hypothetical protein [Syntrophobacterales bacterium]